MGKIRWYKRDPDAALQGMFELTLEERGAYNTVLDLIYSRADNLPDDDRYIAGCCRCDLRVWRRIKKTLIEREKLYIDNGLVRNFRATSVVDAALAKGLSCREAALTRHAKSNDVLAKNNNLADADAEQTHMPYARVKNPDSESERRVPPVVPPKGKPTRKTRWPDGMVLTDEMRAYALEQCPTADADAQFENWRLYCEREDKKYARWDSAWKTWCRNGYNTPMSRGAERKPTQEGIVDVTNRVADRLRAARCNRDQPPVERDGQAERAEGGSRGPAVAVLPDGREVPIHGDSEGGFELAGGSALVANGSEGFRGCAEGRPNGSAALAGEPQRPVGEDPCRIAEGVELAVGRVVRGSTSRPEPAATDGPTEPGDEYGPR